MAVFSQATTLMRRFLYRLPRFKTELPMDFILGDKVVLGVCLNISESGLRGTFSDAVHVGAKGLLSLYRDDRSFQIHAQVESLRGEEARLRFYFDSLQETVALRELMHLLTPLTPPQA